MFGLTGSDWGNMLGLRGVPGIMQSNQLLGSQLFGGMMPQQSSGPSGPGGWDGNNNDQLLSALMGSGSSGGSSSGYGGGNYLGGYGLI